MQPARLPLQLFLPLRSIHIRSAASAMTTTPGRSSVRESPSGITLMQVIDLYYTYPGAAILAGQDSGEGSGRK
jgi:hypothetical protein